MASITNCADGKKAVQFVAPDGKRKTIRLAELRHHERDKIGKTLFLRHEGGVLVHRG